VCCSLWGGGGTWALLFRISNWVLVVRVVDPSWVASPRYHVSVNNASLVIRWVIFAT